MPEELPETGAGGTSGLPMAVVAMLVAPLLAVGAYPLLGRR